LKDLQREIVEIVESVRSALDDVYLVIECLARGIGQPIFEVVHDSVEVRLDGLDDRVKLRYPCLFDVFEPFIQPIQRSRFISFIEDVQCLLFQ